MINTNSIYIMLLFRHYGRAARDIVNGWRCGHPYSEIHAAMMEIQRINPGYDNSLATLGESMELLEKYLV